MHTIVSGQSWINNGNGHKDGKNRVIGGRTISCILEKKNMITFAMNRGYVRNAGVCLHALVCICLSAHCSLLSPPVEV